MITHKFRNTLWNDEVTARLEPDALVWSSGARELQRLPYTEIVEIRVRRAFGGSWSAVPQLVVEGTKDRWIVIGSIGANFWALFPEDRNHTFEIFARDLVARVSSNNPTTRFTLSDNGWWLAAAALLALFLLLIGLTISELINAENWSATWELASSVFLLLLLTLPIPAFVSILRFGRERPFLPDRLPPNFFRP